MTEIDVSVNIILSGTVSTITVEYSVDDGIETLAFQILSLAGLDADTNDLVLVDKFGRELTTNDDIEDIKFVNTASENGGSDSYVAELWCISRSNINTASRCTSIVPDITNNPSYAVDLAGALQPCYRLLDMPFQICQYCRQFFDSSLVIAGNTFPSSNSTVAGEAGSGPYLQCFTCDIDKLIEFGIAAPNAEETLKKKAASFLQGAGIQIPIMLYQRRQLFDCALDQMRSSAPRGQSVQTSQGYRQFKARVESGARTVMVYEDPAQQAAAKQHIDYAKVYEYALAHLGISAPTTAGTTEGAAVDVVVPVPVPASGVSALGAPLSALPPFSKEVAVLEEKALLVGLMRWFKLDFFKWCNKPACDNSLCGAAPGRMDGVGAVEPSPEEKSVGWAGRTELYKCRDCCQVTRFPRVNNPAHLMTTRRGRCGEFANAFCLICRALHLDARYVLDFTDHVWCEVWLPSLQRFAHCDPCERALDTPLMYELGWNKKLTHVLSFSRYGVVDAISRYSRKQNTVLVRRSAEVINESFVPEILAAKDKELEVGFAVRRASLPPPAANLNNGHQATQGLPWDTPIDPHNTEFGSPTLTALRMLAQGKGAVDSLYGLDVSWETLQQRKRLQQRELAALRLNTDITNTTFTKQGRISGDLDWKLSRGEAGEGAVVNADGKCDVSALVSGADRDALCSTGEAAMSKSSLAPAVPSVPLPPWLQQLPEGVKLVTAAGTACHTDIMLATHRNKLLAAGGLDDIGAHESTSVSVCAAPVCYGWGGNLFPRVADVGETAVLLGGSGKSFSVGTEPASLTRLRNVRGDHSVLGGASAVSITRNSNCEPKAVPQYLAIRHASNEALSANVENISLYPIEGYTCTVPAETIFSPEGGDKSVTGVTEIAKAKCLQDPRLLGFSVLLDGKNAGEVSHVVYFNDAGYPLECLAGAVTFVKACADPVGCACDNTNALPLPQQEDATAYVGAEATAKQACTDQANRVAVAEQGAAVVSEKGGSSNIASHVCTRRSYFHLGGAYHNDTVPFDSSAFLQALDVVTDVGGVIAAESAVIRLSKVSVFAGENLVNGVQCIFELTYPHLQQTICVSSPLCSSDCDSPTAHELELGSQDRVVSVLCRSGALVDYVEIRTAAGQVLRAGGSGGGEVTEMTVPEGTVLCGFFGGTGGHLHNVGVVLMETVAVDVQASGATHKPSALACATRTQSYLSLVQLCESRGMSDCGMLNYYRRPNLESNRHSNVGHFAEILHFIAQNNSPETARLCLKTVVTYAENILKDPLEYKYQCIKLTNAHLRQSVLQAIGGVQLLCFGPCAFRLTLSTTGATAGQYVLQSAVAAEVLVADKSASFRAIYVSWLRNYVDTLKAAADTL